jgi:hypothetical protein
MEKLSDSEALPENLAKLVSDILKYIENAEWGHSDGSQ